MIEILLAQAGQVPTSVWERIIDAGISLFIMSFGFIFMWRYFSKELENKDKIIAGYVDRNTKLNDKYIKDSQENLVAMLEVNKIMDRVLETQIDQKGEIIKNIKESTVIVKDHINSKVELMMNKLNNK